VFVVGWSSRVKLGWVKRTAVARVAGERKDKVRLLRARVCLVGAYLMGEVREVPCTLAW
jgi:hypothetical protein